jgi:hypothetical protein
MDKDWLLSIRIQSFSCYSSISEIIRRYLILWSDIMFLVILIWILPSNRLSKSCHISLTLVILSNTNVMSSLTTFMIMFMMNHFDHSLCWIRWWDMMWLSYILTHNIFLLHSIHQEYSNNWSHISFNMRNSYMMFQRPVVLCYAYLMPFKLVKPLKEIYALRK